MAKGYTYQQDDETYVPSRPSRRRDSSRAGESNYGYEYSASGSTSRRQRSAYTGGHYAESPIQIPPGERTLEIVPDNRRQRRRSSSEDGAHEKQQHSSRRSSTLPGGGAGSRLARTSSRPSGHGGTTTVSKVTRSRSLSSRPAGVAVYHPFGHSTNEIYQAQSAPPSRPPTRMSSKSGRSHATGVSGTGGKSSTQAGVVVETMSAPNPFCPNTRGVCCLMVLVNLALILVAIGFIIVLQLYEPAFVWNIGIVIVVFGFVTFLIAMVYCMCICQESINARRGGPAQGELYWTHHWQKNITIPEIKTRDKEKWEEQDRFPEDELSDTSSRDYPRLYLESDYDQQRTDREADFETEQETGGHHPPPASKSGKYTSPQDTAAKEYHGRH